MAGIWAIGDIHGEREKLERLLTALPRDEEDILLFLGDYIDRGPDSAGVVKRLLAEYDSAPAGKVVLLWGNHEDMAAANYGFSAPSDFCYGPQDWFQNGGRTTLESYGIGLDENAPCPDSLARLFGLLKTFWRAPADQYPLLSHCIWVHAGILPGKQPETSSGNTLLWVREPFLRSHDRSGRLVIHGHSPFANLRVQSDKIGVDTGAVYGGILSALRLPDGKIVQVNPSGDLSFSSLKPLSKL